MLIKTISDITGSKGSSSIYYLMQDQPRKMVVVGVRGLYAEELEKAQQTANDFIMMKSSYDWIDGEMTDNELDGTCALEVTNDYDNKFSFDILLSRVKSAKIYGDGEALGILVSERYTNGEDDLEIIMEDARLVCVITL